MNRYKKAFLYGFLAIFILFGVLSAVFYSGWGQKIARSYVLSALQKEGFRAEVESIEGFLLPDTIRLKNLTFDLPEGSTLTIESVLAKISFLYFLKNEFHLSHLNASNIVWTDRKGQKKNSRLAAPAASPSLPMSFSIGSFDAKNVQLFDLEPIHLQGKLAIGAGRKKLLIDVQADHLDDSASFFFRRKKNGFFEWQAQVHVLDSKWLALVHKIPLNGAWDVDAKASGSLKKGIKGRFAGKTKLQTDFKPLEGLCTFQGRFRQDVDGLWQFPSISFQGNDLKVQANASLSAEGELESIFGQLQTEQLFLSSLEGKMIARWTLRKEGENFVGKTVAQFPEILFKEFSIKPLELILDTVNRGGTFDLKGAEWNLSGGFLWDKTLQIQNAHFEGPQMKGFGEWEFAKDGSKRGKTELEIDNLQVIKNFAPSLDPYGQMTVKTNWEDNHLTLDFMARELYVKSIYFEEAAFYSDLKDPFGDLTGIISIDVEKGRFRDLKIDSALLETSIEGQNWPFKLFAEGVWNRDFESHFEGIWSLKNQDFQAEVHNFYGLFYSHPFSLVESVQIEAGPERIKISETEIKLADASVTGKFFKVKNFGSLFLQLHQFPLDFLSINPLEVSVNGLLDLEADLTENQKQIQGRFAAAISQVEISRLGETEAITAEGALQGELSASEFSLQGKLSTRGEPLGFIDLQIPGTLAIDPFEMQFMPSRETKGKVHFEGRIEDFLDFLNLRSHWFEGNCKSDLSWSNTLSDPQVEGFIQIKDGYYENYYTGTQLTDLNADFIAQKGRLQLKSLQAKDDFGNGSLSGNGAIELRLDKKLPFHFHLAFHNFHFVQLGFASATADSDIDITGDLEAALAKGEMHIVESDLSIPEKLSKTPPNLKVVYLNAQKPMEKPQAAFYKSYPLHLDFSIDTPNVVLISGRGLQSKWKGNFSLKGTQNAPQPSGKLELEQGEFSFSGRTFKLTRGALSFASTTGIVPHIDLSGETQQQGISIIVNLEGPLNRPQLTFQSVPALPLSAIISYLLFGQDVSEINGLQALQLATAITNIAGQTPDVLESTRRSLGIDRLSIVSSPGSGGEDTLALQVGKYVAEGVLVSITQSANNSAPNITIEVDIGAGFYFVAETDQLEEQGKFGVKWNRNY